MSIQRTPRITPKLQGDLTEMVLLTPGGSFSIGIALHFEQDAEFRIHLSSFSEATCLPIIKAFSQILWEGSQVLWPIISKLCELGGVTYLRPQL